MIAKDYDDFDKLALASWKARKRRWAAHWYGCSEEEIMEVKKEWRIPTRFELTQRVRDYLEKDGYQGDAYGAALKIVQIFNQWTVEVIAPNLDDVVDS